MTDPVIEVRVPIAEIVGLPPGDQEDVVERYAREADCAIWQALGPARADGDCLVYRFPVPRPFFPKHL